MARVLYGVSPIGLGHATRAHAVAEELRAQGSEVLLVSGGNALDYLRGAGFAVEDAVAGAVPAVVAGEMKRTSLWYARYWLAYRETKRAVQRVMERYHPDLVVGDEEFGTVSLALDKGLRHALVTDELELGFARSALARAIEARVSEWYKGLLSDVSLVLIPQLGDDSGNRRYTGPITRRVTKSRRDVTREFSLPEKGPMVLLSLSGSGIGDYLFRGTLEAVGSAEIPGAFLVVSGNRGEKKAGESVYDLGMVPDNQNLVAAADLVVSTAGKSTIDEAAEAGTPVIPIPIRNHSEQERNAAALGFSPGDASRLRELILERIGKRGPPSTSRGAQKASQLLLSKV